MNPKKKALSRLNGIPGVTYIFLIVFVAASVFVPRFFSVGNLSTMLLQACTLTLLSVAMALTLMMGSIDLSMGGVVSMTGVIMAYIMRQGGSAWLALPVGLLIGALFGMLNGLMVTKLKIPPFIVTFATMYACRGLGWVYLRNRVLYPLDESFRFIATGKLFKIGKFLVKTPVLIALLLLLIAWYVLRRTNAGRKIYFTGANPTAARFSGINTDRVKIGVYVASSVLAAFAGLMYVARLNACEPGLGHDSNFDAITVALIGGFAMSGGYGNIWGVLGGALVTYTIQSGMNSLQMPSELQDLISGCLIIFAVFINQILANKRMQLENDLRDAANAARKS